MYKLLRPVDLDWLTESIVAQTAENHGQIEQQWRQFMRPIVGPDPQPSKTPIRGQNTTMSLPI